MKWLILPFVLLVWTFLELRTARPDGTFRKIHPYRRMMLFVMPTRNEAVVYFDAYVKADALLEYLEEARERFGANLTHALVAATAIGLAQNPGMNQFSVGRRLYVRNGTFVSFSMKRQKMNKKARLAAVKMEMNAQESFQQLCERINGQINVQRSGKKTHTDKEFNLFEWVPRPMLRLAVRSLNVLDYYGLMPGWFIRDDAMYTSVFVANLGSVGMAAGYHHLYEWGTCPLFVMVGQTEQRPVVVTDENGVSTVVPQRTLHLRFSYDERIEDGLTAGHGIASMVQALENPRKSLGCLAEDGSDQVPLA
jgi:hypothetical protein